MEQPEVKLEEGQAPSWRDISETVLGLAAEGIIMKDLLNPEHFAPPFNLGARKLKNGGTREDLVIPGKIDTDMLNRMHNKVARYNGAGTLYDWMSMLETAYCRWVLGELKARNAYRLQNNEDVDLAEEHQKTREYMERSLTGGIRAASAVDWQTYKFFMPSGNEYIDRIFGGLPSDGPIVTFGDAGTGKSHWGAGIIADLLNYHKAKTAGVYSFEMAEEHWLKREIAMFPHLMGVLDRLYVSGQIHNPEQLVNEVNTHQFDIIVIDDMENMVKGAPDAGKYEEAYKIIKSICRFSKIPVIVLAQPNRGGKKSGTFLKKYDIAWAGENDAALMIALQNAGRDQQGWTESNPKYPMEDYQMQYQIFLKVRDEPIGFKGLGAIVTKMERDTDGMHKHKIFRGPLYDDQWKLWNDFK